MANSSAPKSQASQTSQTTRTSQTSQTTRTSRATTRTTRLARGARRGALIAAAIFFANLAGTFATIGWLFAPTVDSLLLLAVPCVVIILLGAVIGISVTVLWPARWRFQPRRIHVAILGVILAAVATTGYSARSGRNLPDPGPRPTLSAQNPTPILWIVLDALRADTTYDGRVHGDGLAARPPQAEEQDSSYRPTFPLAPNLAAFAKNAFVFTDAEATAGWTIPSMAAMLTGIHNTTMDASAGHLPDWAPTIAERLRAAGYTTHAVVDNALLEPRNGFAAGFESFFQRSSYRFAFSLPSFRALPQGLREFLREKLYTSYFGAPGTTDAALDVIARLDPAAPKNKKTPPFVLVHYMDPHAPYYPHAALPPDPQGSEDIVFWRARDRVRTKPELPPTPGQMLQLRHRYKNELRFLDAEVGRLIAGWRKQYGDNTLIIVTADHGEEFLDHGHLSHSLTVHREMVHIPLLIALPSAPLRQSPLPQSPLPQSPLPQTIHTPVSLIDLTPTVLDVAGVSVTHTHTDTDTDTGPSIQGKSWLPWLRGDAPSPDPNRPMMSSQSRHGRRTYRYREGKWSYIKSMFYDDSPTQQGFYDLTTDPAERNDILNLNKEIFAPLSQRYEKLAAALWKSYDPKSPSESNTNEESLRALGYIE